MPRRFSEDGHAGSQSRIRREKAELIEDVELAAALGESVDRVFLAWIKTLRPMDHWYIQTRGFVRTTKIDNAGVCFQRRVEAGELIPLYSLGFWNLLSDHISHDAILKIRDLGNFYHLLAENPNAAEWLVWWLVALSADERMHGIFGGMECIVDTLKEKLGENFERNYYHPNHRVKGLEVVKSAGIRLTFQGPVSEGLPAEFSRVILALPRRALQEVERNSSGAFAGRPAIRDLLESCFGFPLVKTFAVLRQRWWEQETMANRFANRVPTRELHYWKALCEGDKQGLIMIYTDRPASSFWANYVPSGPQLDARRGKVELPAERGLVTEACPPNTTACVKTAEAPEKRDTGTEKSKSEKPPLPLQLRKLLVQKVSHYVDALHTPDVTSDDVVWYGIRDWGRAPYSGAAHAWRPERRFWVAMNHLASIPVGGNGKSTNRSIHVCGEAYSDYHGFIEGALRSATYVIHRIFLGDKTRPTLTWLKDLLELDSEYHESLRAWVEDLDNVTSEDKVFDRE